MLTLSALTTSSNLINKVSIRHEAESISLLNQFRARPDLGEKGGYERAQFSKPCKMQNLNDLTNGSVSDSS